MKHLTLDFETYDPGLKKFGMGWAFKLNYPSYVFDLLGVALITDDGEEIYTDDWEVLDKALAEHDSIICHNSTYDLGCLLVLATQGHINWKISEHVKYDTLILAKLYNQNYFSYSLDNLAKFFGIKGKSSDLLHDFAWSTGLYQDTKRQETGRNTHTRPSYAVLDTFCKSNMNLFPADLVGEYAIQDVKTTLELFNKLFPRTDYIDLELYSDLQEIVVDSKSRGVCIDIDKAKKVSVLFDEIATETASKVYKIAGEEFNINSIKQLSPVLLRLGYDLELSEKGNHTIGAKWLEQQTGEIIEAISTYRQANKMKRDFIDKMIDYQEAIPVEHRDDKYGIIFPTMKILGATATGRFSSGGGSGCKEVSIHQIPSRNAEFGKPCREIFVPHVGEKWGYGDFNSQESRIQVHYAKLLNCAGVDDVVNDWYANKMMSFHDKVASLACINRDQAKTINLGLSYGMGEAKLCASLGLSRQSGGQLLQQYNELVPFMNQLKSICSSSLVQAGYIKTIGGRRLVKGRDKGSEKDGLNKLVQGSAADQCKRAMQLAYRNGIRLLFAVHDELNFSTDNIERDLPLIQECMEGAYDLCVPVVAEMGSGNSWLEAKEAG